MTVAYLKGRSTEDHERYIALQSSDQSLIFAGAEGVHEFEMTLTIGEVFSLKHPTTESSFQLVTDDGIAITHGAAVTVEIAEDLRVPLNLFGVIFPKGSLAHVTGLFCPTAKIDPGFRGRLRLVLFNCSGQRIVLRREQAIASAVFMRTDATVGRALAKPKSKLNPTVESRWTAGCRFLVRHRATVLSVLALVVSAIISLTAASFSYQSMQIAKRAEVERDQAKAALEEHKASQQQRPAAVRGAAQ